jgi:hypothetical protein
VIEAVPAAAVSPFAFSSPLQIPVGSGPSDLTRTLLSGFFPIVGRIVSCRASEVLKAKGKPKMTLYDGLRIGWRDLYVKDASA